MAGVEEVWPPVAEATAAVVIPAAPIPRAEILEKGGYVNSSRVRSKASIFFCPEVASNNRGWNGTQPDYVPVNRLNAKKGSQGVFARQAWQASVRSLSLSQVKSPSSLLMIADACDGSDVFQPGFAFAYDITPATVSDPLPVSHLAPRHGYKGPKKGRFGALFCDGHVEAFSIADPRLQDQDFCDDLVIPF